ncbi:MAG: excinuclease ABC subunit UvrC [Bacilli bacterium]|nr:excinuclease ABC subunit UvrC [Bacilli bacterium]MBO6194895.1 excinuclease ABC subunit UvrC [Bacilli bacterium]
MDEKVKEHIKNKLSLLPRKPGCYLMKDSTGTIIYVGKAKILKNRVSSYFMGTKFGKTKALVSNIVDFEYIVTTTEKEAFLLEINLIKKYDPKYNIIFRDDKSYPYIMLTTSPYPKLEVVRPRNKKRKNAKLFGPYPSSYAAKNIVNMLNRIYPMQKCRTFEDKLCLYYHIGECLGYCKLKIEKENIEEMVKEITSFLNGNYDDITKKLKNDMKEASDKLNFEKAKEIKDLLDYISKVLEKQKIDLTDTVNRDIFNYYVKDDFISIQVLHSRNGNLVERNSYIYELNEEEIDVMNNFILSFYDNNNDMPKEILIPDNLDSELIESALEIKVIKPTRGPKKKLVEMALENAKIKLNEKFDLIKNDYNRTVHANEELGKLLGINIHRIESFDNSHLFGTYTVSGMVVFVDGRASKKDYRKYKIIGNAKDDYHLMQETVERRYSRVINDNLAKPDIILTDGGIIQINATKEILDNLCLDIPVYGMQKNDKHRICALIDPDGKEIPIEKNSDVFHFLEKISEEVHRFAISYHKDIRSKGSLSSILDEIPGIGEKRRKDLIKEFKSINKIKEASIEELSKVIPEDVAKNIKEYLKDDE